MWQVLWNKTSNSCSFKSRILYVHRTSHFYLTLGHFPNKLGHESKIWCQIWNHRKRLVIKDYPSLFFCVSNYNCRKCYRSFFKCKFLEYATMNYNILSSTCCHLYSIANILIPFLKTRMKIQHRAEINIVESSKFIIYL